jgi:hypothetical protein
MWFGLLSGGMLRLTLKGLQQRNITSQYCKRVYIAAECYVAILYGRLHSSGMLRRNTVWCLAEELCVSALRNYGGNKYANNQL